MSYKESHKKSATFSIVLERELVLTIIPSMEKPKTTLPTIISMSERISKTIINMCLNTSDDDDDTSPKFGGVHSLSMKSDASTMHANRRYSAKRNEEEDSFHLFARNGTLV
jgi:hypothetical protein